MGSVFYENVGSSPGGGHEILDWCDRIQLLCELVGTNHRAVRFNEVAHIVNDYARSIKTVLESGGPEVLAMLGGSDSSVAEYFKKECGRVCDPKNKGVLCLEIEASELLAKVDRFKRLGRDKALDDVIGAINAFLGPDWSK